MSDSIYKLDDLLNSDIVPGVINRRIFDGFSPSEWLPRIIETVSDKFDGEDFYKRIARLYGLEYLSDIDVPLSPEETIAYRIPTEILIKSQLYPFKLDGKLYIASSTPFVDKKSLEEVISYTGSAGYQLVVTNPIVLKDALKKLYYIEFSVVSESSLRFSQNDLSASPPQIIRLAKFLIAIGIIVIVLIFFLPKSFLLGLFLLINLFYIYLNALRFTTFIRAIQKRDKINIDISQDEIEQLEDGYLPRYTILVPLRFEARIVNRLVNHLSRMDYPKSKLEIMFLIGVDDTETAKALKKCGVDKQTDDAGNYGHYMTIVKVPKSNVDTKPLVCNYGLRFATGNYTVIYDAEDRPDYDQLKKAVAGYQISSLDTVCLQGKLNFYNDRKNLLTRFFTLEYGMWYDYFLPGLQTIQSPIPLGGTSNHFVTDTLRQTGEWDPYNVTEDADMGMRLYRRNYRTRILNSYTLEEATSTVGAWLKQRARWEKGFLATLIVHLRHPIQLYKELGLRKFIFGVTVFFGNFYMPFINPLLWTITILWLLDLFTLGALPIYIWLPAVFNLIAGNLIHMSMHFMAAIRLKRYDLAPLAIIIPFYWSLISIATYKAAWDIFFSPYRWSKTAHGKS